MSLNHKSILITGGTGSFGKAFVRYLLGRFPNISRIVIFSRDEQKQYEMAHEFPPRQYPIQYLLGDVRDYARMLEVTKGIDVIIHSAAMKQIQECSWESGSESGKNLLRKIQFIQPTLQGQLIRFDYSSSI